MQFLFVTQLPAEVPQTYRQCQKSNLAIVEDWSDAGGPPVMGKNRYLGAGTQIQLIIVVQNIHGSMICKLLSFSHRREGGYNDIVIKQRHSVMTSVTGPATF
jgi:hypothetical protein